MSVWWCICSGCGVFREISGPRQGLCQSLECASRCEETRADNKKTKTV